MAVRRDAANAKLGKFFEKLGNAGQVGTCAACGLMLPHEFAEPLLHGFDARNKAWCSFELSIMKLLGKQHFDMPPASGASSGDQNRTHVLNQFKLQPCDRCGRQFCQACRQNKGDSTACVECIGGTQSIRRGGANPKLQKFFEKVGNTGHVGTCAGCGVLLPHEFGQPLLQGFDDQNKAWCSYQASIVKLLGGQHFDLPGASAANPDAATRDHVLNQFKLQPCGDCGQLFCRACRKDNAQGTTCAGCDKKANAWPPAATSPPSSPLETEAKQHDADRGPESAPGASTSTESQSIGAPELADGIATADDSSANETEAAVQESRVLPDRTDVAGDGNDAGQSREAAVHRFVTDHAEELESLATELSSVASQEPAATHSAPISSRSGGTVEADAMEEAKDEQWTSCPDCGARVKRQSLDKHRKKWHPTKSLGDGAKQSECPPVEPPVTAQPDQGEWTTCSDCGTRLKLKSLQKHRRKCRAADTEPRVEVSAPAQAGSASSHDRHNGELKAFYERSEVADFAECDRCKILLPTVDSILTLTLMIANQPQAFSAFKDLVVLTLGQNHFDLAPEVHGHPRLRHAGQYRHRTQLAELQRLRRPRLHRLPQRFG